MCREPTQGPLLDPKPQFETTVLYIDVFHYFKGLSFLSVVVICYCCYFFLTLHGRNMNVAGRFRRVSLFVCLAAAVKSCDGGGLIYRQQKALLVQQSLRERYRRRWLKINKQDCCVVIYFIFYYLLFIFISFWHQCVELPWLTFLRKQASGYFLC